MLHLRDVVKLTDRAAMTPMTRLNAQACLSTQHGESQGHTVDKKDKTLSSKDVQTQATKAGFRTKEGGDHRGDAASTTRGVGEKPTERGIGNKEGIGFVDQVGSQSASAKHWEEVNKKKESQEKGSDERGKWVPM